MYSIYTLVDPRNGDVRYVGMSKNPQRRLYEHRRPDDINSAKNEWIQSLKEQHLKPTLAIIDTNITNRRDALQCEKEWISRYLEQGANLTNRPNVIEEFWANVDDETRTINRSPERYVDVRMML